MESIPDPVSEICTDGNGDNDNESDPEAMKPSSPLSPSSIVPTTATATTPMTVPIASSTDLTWVVIAVALFALLDHTLQGMLTSN
ncbi:hypothetical protein BASA81_000059 [Batrachochytrium salamandrivorans]|nr:hypothetical protein BASA81_000059 [Batrachochytrium salamandrivorans]